jgi:hypothetical protein
MTKNGTLTEYGARAVKVIVDDPDAGTELATVIVRD